MRTRLILCCALLPLLHACKGGDNHPVKDIQVQPVKDTALAPKKRVVSAPALPKTGNLHFQNVEGTTGQNTSEIKVGEIVSFRAGKFNDAGKMDTAYVIKTKQGEGGPDDDGKPDEYTVRFTGSTKSINIGCCDARLINEGDLNNDGKDELSVFQYPDNGNTCTFYTYTSARGNWKELIESFLVPAAGEPVTDAELQKKVFKEGGVVYFIEIQDSDDDFVQVKTRAVLR